MDVFIYHTPGDRCTHPSGRQSGYFGKMDDDPKGACTLQSQQSTAAAGPADSAQQQQQSGVQQRKQAQGEVARRDGGRNGGVSGEAVERPASDAPSISPAFRCCMVHLRKLLSHLTTLGQLAAHTAGHDHCWSISSQHRVYIKDRPVSLDLLGIGRTAALVGRMSKLNECPPYLPPPPALCYMRTTRTLDKALACQTPVTDNLSVLLKEFLKG